MASKVSPGSRPTTPMPVSDQVKAKFAVIESEQSKQWGSYRTILNNVTAINRTSLTELENNDLESLVGRAQTALAKTEQSFRLTDFISACGNAFVGLGFVSSKELSKQKMQDFVESSGALILERKTNANNDKVISSTPIDEKNVSSLMKHYSLEPVTAAKQNVKTLLFTALSQLPNKADREALAALIETNEDFTIPGAMYGTSYDPAKATKEKVLSIVAPFLAAKGLEPLADKLINQHNAEVTKQRALDGTIMNTDSDSLGTEGLLKKARLMTALRNDLDSINTGHISDEDESGMATNAARSQVAAAPNFPGQSKFINGFEARFNALASNIVPHPPFPREKLEAAYKILTKNPKTAAKNIDRFESRSAVGIGKEPMKSLSSSTSLSRLKTFYKVLNNPLEKSK